MADITTSLFPEASTLLQQRLDAAGQMGMELGMQGADRFALGALGRGAAMGGTLLGQGLNKVFGVQSPEEQEAAATKAIADNLVKQGVNLQSSDGMLKMAQELMQQGKYNAAQKASAAANILKEKETAIGLHQAQTKLATARTEQAGKAKETSTESERLRALISNAEVKLAGGEQLTPQEAAQVRWAISKETKPKYITDPETGTTTVIPALDINTATPNIAKFINEGKTATPSTVAPVANPFQPTAPTAGTTPTATAPAIGGIQQIKTGAGKPPKELDASLVKELGNIDANLTKLDASIKDTSALSKQIDNLDIGLVQNFSRGAQAWLGVNTQDRLAFDALRRSVLQQANNLLLLAKGTQTEGDAQRARDQIADENTWKNKDALKAAYTSMQKTLRDTQAALQAQRSTIATKGKGEAPTASSRSETIISRAMQANPNFSREQVINELKKAGYL